MCLFDQLCAINKTPPELQEKQKYFIMVTS